MNQVVSCYLTLFPYIKNYLDISDFSDIDEDYRPMVLFISIEYVASLNEVNDYLCDVDYI